MRDFLYKCEIIIDNIDDNLREYGSLYSSEQSNFLKLTSDSLKAFIYSIRSEGIF